METMKSVRYEKYGPPEVLKIVAEDKPIPKNNEVLINLKATTVTATECIFRKGEPYFSRLFTGLTKPKITRLGEELAGVIEKVGKDISEYKEGDRIFGTAGPTFGANAEYICLPEDGVFTLMPENMTFEEAASIVDGVLTALPFLRDTGNIQSGQKVLINGASGSIGTAAVQLAKYFKAEVTGVCSTSNIDLVKSIGADFVVDYTKEDFTSSGKNYDIIFDTVGKLSFSKAKKALTKKGIFLEAGIKLSILPTVIWTSLLRGRKLKIAATGVRPPKERKKDLLLLKELIESKIIKPVIDRRYDLDEIVEAHKYVDKGHKRGNVVIKI
jgi:NADPH:quinone reductase-like Zn-dependent oxidoreductase